MFYNYLYSIFVGMKRREFTEIEISEIIKGYSKGMGTHQLGSNFKVGHKRIRELLITQGVELRSKRGPSMRKDSHSVVVKTKSKVYVSEIDDKTKYVARCKETGKEYDDVNNLSGALTRHIIGVYGDVPIPTNTYQRKKYEIINGKKWFELYFTIVPINKVKVRKCDLCDWESEDLTNKTGAFTKHINTKHNLTISEYIELYPNNSDLFLTRLNRDAALSDNKLGVVCLECDKTFLGLTETHMISNHNMTIEDYKNKWGDDIQVFSDSTITKLHDQAVEINKGMVHKFISKPQQEVKEYIESVLGLTVLNNDKKVLSGTELDIVVPSRNVAIEYNGLYWHTERLGKHKNYHLDKTKMSEDVGFRLIHVFEDEWKNKKDIVKNRIIHILGCGDVSVYARKCVVKEVGVDIKNDFLLSTHIQGPDNSSVRLGLYFEDELVSVMTFSKLRKSMGSKGGVGEYELVRFSSLGVVGGAGKLLKYFIRNYNPTSIISYADRRWSQGDLYEKLGFELVSMGRPNYWYTKDYKKREYRFNYRKDILVSKGYDKSKTENEIMSELGYDRIWDCGSLKYELKLK